MLVACSCSLDSRLYGVFRRFRRVPFMGYAILAFNTWCIVMRVDI